MMKARRVPGCFGSSSLSPYQMEYPSQSCRKRELFDVTVVDEIKQHHVVEYEKEGEVHFTPSSVGESRRLVHCRGYQPPKLT